MLEKLGHHLVYIHALFNGSHVPLNLDCWLPSCRNKATKGISKSLRKKRAVVGAITGLSAASLLATPQADAAQEIVQLAASELSNIVRSGDAAHMHIRRGPCMSEPHY